MDPAKTTSPTSETHADAALTDAEIEAILEREAGAPPPEQGEAPQPQLVAREPGRGLLGKLLVWLVIAFVLASVYKLNRP